MSDGESIKIVDAFDLDDELRSLLKPGEMVRDAENRRHRLPRYFYEVPSREAAMDIRMTPHFGLNEFVLVDLREAPRLQEFPQESGPRFAFEERRRRDRRAPVATSTED